MLVTKKTTQKNYCLTTESKTLIRSLHFTPLTTLVFLSLGNGRKKTWKKAHYKQQILSLV